MLSATTSMLCFATCTFALASKIRVQFRDHEIDDTRAAHADMSRIRPAKLLRLAGAIEERDHGLRRSGDARRG